MKKGLLRLINILKTDEELKGLIEELKFGCYIEGEDFIGRCLYKTVGGCFTYKENTDSEDIIINTAFVLKDRFKIIGQIHEGYLRMFMKDETLQQGDEWVYLSTNEGSWIDCKLDNTKDLMSQSEEFYKSLSDWLIKEFKIDESLFDKE